MKMGNFRFHATEDVTEGYQKNLHKICKNVKILPKHKKKKIKKITKQNKTRKYAINIKVY